MLTLAEKNPYQVLGVDISPHSKEDFFHVVNNRLKEPEEESPPLFVVTVNPEIAIQAIIDNEFKEILKSTSINTADGVGISWAINYLYHQHIDRITGSDSLELICKYCAVYNQSVYLYGAAPGVAHHAANILCDRIPHLEVEGAYSPESRDIPFKDLPEQVQDSLQKVSVIFVALGAPHQEKWIYENLKHFTHCKLIIGIGGSFDFITGEAKRAPQIFRKSGLEWMYRLYQEPSRWRRMLRLPLFALNILLLKASKTSVKSSDAVTIGKEEIA